MRMLKRGRSDAHTHHAQPVLFLQALWSAAYGTTHHYEWWQSQRWRFDPDPSHGARPDRDGAPATRGCGRASARGRSGTSDGDAESLSAGREGPYCAAGCGIPRGIGGGDVDMAGDEWQRCYE